jgi:transcriptional regulator with XRE-family HTH domain
MKSFNRFKTMQGIGAVRTRLGLSQELFAMELGISRSMLSKVENKNRTLPTSALVKLAALEISLAGKQTIAVQQEPHPSELAEDYNNDHAPSLLHLQQKTCTAEAEKLQFQLDIMMIRYQQVLFSLDQVEQMIEENNANPGRFFPGLLEAHRYAMLRKLNKCSLPAQATLRHKIALQRAAAGLHAVTVRISGVDSIEDL